MLEPPPRCSRLLIAVLGLVFAHACSAEALPTYPLPVLLKRSTVVARCKAVEVDKRGVPTGEFEVLEVLHGRGLKAGESVDVRGWSMYEAVAPMTEQPTEWILFLKGKLVCDVAVGLELVLSGVRCRTKNGPIAEPIQFYNPGDYYLHNVPPNAKSYLPSWDELVEKIRESDSE